MHLFRFPSLILAGGLAAALHPLPAQTITDPDAVTLARVDVVGDKEKSFSLPLDAAAATGSRLGLVNRDLPVSVSVVTQEVMQLRGFRTGVEAVEGAVGMTGGIQYGSIPGFATRGFTANSVSVLRDGIRQNTGSQSARTIDAFNLDRVEVLKGPASLMFGEGAVGGAVNYLSKLPDRAWRGEVFASHGSWNHLRLGLGAGGPVIPGRLFARADFSFAERDGYVERAGERYSGFSGALGWDVSDAFRLTLFTTYLEDWNESYYGNPVIYDAVDRYDPATGAFTRLVAKAVAATDRLVNPRVASAARRTNYNILDNYAETENSFHRLRAEWTPAGDWEVRNEAYLATQLLRWRNLESNLWNPVTQLVDRSSFVHIYRDDLLAGNRLDVTSKRDFLGRPNRLLLGGFAERNDLIRGGTPAGYATTLGSVSLLDPDVGFGFGDARRFQKNTGVTIDTIAVYLENALDLAPGMKLVAGLRQDWIDIERIAFITPANPARTVYAKHYAPTTGRAGLVWSVTEGVNLYASYSHAAEPVTQLVSLTAAQNDFSLQQGRQFEIGAKGTLQGGKVDFTVALYDIEKNDLLTSTLDPGTGLRINQQIGAQISQGAEFAVAWSPTADWRLEGNIAWTWKAAYEDFNENLGTGVVSRDGNTPPNVPEVVASAHVSRAFGRHWRVGGGPRHVDRRAAGNSNLIWTPAYTTLEASVTYLHAGWSATLRGRNLLDKDYEEWATGLMQRLADPLSVELSIHHTF